MRLMLANVITSMERMSTFAQGLLSPLATDDVEPNGESNWSSLTLASLLSPANTLPFIAEACDIQSFDRLLSLLPRQITGRVLRHEESANLETSTSIESNFQHLNHGQKQIILQKVLRSPQLCQSLDSLTLALRCGGLAALSEALGFEVDGISKLNSNKESRQTSAIDIFVDGVRRSIDR